ncbi:uncharacterized protein PHACADRAFT_183026 [Phanerochaete carnosa HHB-10118-sp]|uniref:Zn(2)-C6 fungal-type domain-containing protein n=1 Tax=Phanerochaete carnosa (strain HHB-10118-sp) TaxID=650164 RepID=K5WBB8_PHACS|nr:uncharacterized protein PHACADRAFT_183026 [Phanerochaete carnosa HHB-10118-sp]EKM56274.1 hypothetical protein PHACADRAFT_183026 [Phanerochaete carnosa HHB-10118-sp]
MPPSRPARSFAVSMPLDIPRSDDPWNLRPYDVPWGPSYYQYKPGKLPGHDGDCLMLRSPTPIEQRRTAIACRHCRQRKAKCSGDQPACSRCAYSGRKCVYPEERRPQPANKPRASKTARDILSDSFRRDSSISLASTSTDSSESSSEEVYAKEEDDRDAESYLLYDMRSEGHLQHWPPYCTIDSPRSEYSSPPSTAYSEVDYDVVVGGGGGSQTYFDYHEPGASTSTPSTLSAAIYAPRPVHPSAAPPDLAYPHSEIVPQVPGEPVRSPPGFPDRPRQSRLGGGGRLSKHTGREKCEYVKVPQCPDPVRGQRTCQLDPP